MSSTPEAKCWWHRSKLEQAYPIFRVDQASELFNIVCHVACHFSRRPACYAQGVIKWRFEFWFLQTYYSLILTSKSSTGDCLCFNIFWTNNKLTSLCVYNQQRPYSGVIHKGQGTKGLIESSFYHFNHVPTWQLWAPHTRQQWPGPMLQKNSFKKQETLLNPHILSNDRLHHILHPNVHQFLVSGPYGR